MANDFASRLKKTQETIKKYEKNSLTAEKIGKTKELIKTTRRLYETIKDTDQNEPGSGVFSYGGTNTSKTKSGELRVAGVKNVEDLGYAGTKASTTRLIIADDYAKKGHFSRAYALLRKTVEAESNFKSERSKQEAENLPKIYEAVGKRALRYADKVAKTNVTLARDLFDIAEQCERYMKNRKK
jgi:hypothetical protein